MKKQPAASAKALDPGPRIGDAFPRFAMRFLAAVLLLAAVANGVRAQEDRAAYEAGLATITVADLHEHLRQLASPELEGRDTPSVGLQRAARYIAGRFADAGLEAHSPPATATTSGGEEAPPAPVPEDRARAFLWTYKRELPEPDAPGCALSLELADGTAKTFGLGRDFVPLRNAEGEAKGELIFVGYGIRSRDEGYDDLPDKGIAGKIAMIVEGEPRHAKRFEGPEVSVAASLWAKLATLREAHAAGALVVRRPPEPPKGAKKPSDPLPPAELGFRTFFAPWNDAKAQGEAREARANDLLPALEISLACASELLGEDVDALADRIDASIKPVRKSPKGRTVALRGRTRKSDVPIDNVVAIVRGRDPALAAEFVVLGAHYDHIGVDERGRIGNGADDNASGTSAMLEIAQAFAVAKPRRSVLLCAFSGEEKGFWGSQALCEKPPIDKQAMAAMVNLDMLGFGEADNCAVLGLDRNPTLAKLVDRAQKLSRTGVRDITTKHDEDIFQRSDQISFHKIGVPVLFFFEGLPISKNVDYHTWRDTLEGLDVAKIHNTTRLVYNTVWLLANDDSRPPAPVGSR
jgi:hypothetical protein